MYLQICLNILRFPDRITRVYNSAFFLCLTSQYRLKCERHLVIFMARAWESVHFYSRCKMTPFFLNSTGLCTTVQVLHPVSENLNHPEETFHGENSRANHYMIKCRMHLSFHRIIFAESETMVSGLF